MRDGMGVVGWDGLNGGALLGDDDESVEIVATRHLLRGQKSGNTW